MLFSELRTDKFLTKCQVRRSSILREHNQNHAFQAEIAQLLDSVIDSLYTDKEIFIRELILKAADPTEKLRFLQGAGAETFESDRAQNPLYWSASLLASSSRTLRSA